MDKGNRTTWQTVQNVTAERVCLPLPLHDGETYDLYVRATDLMDNQRGDNVTVKIDSTPPDLQEMGLRGRWGRTGLYVHNFTDLSRMVLVIEASDSHSGLASLSWSVGTQNSSSDLGLQAFAVQRLGSAVSDV